MGWASLGPITATKATPVRGFSANPNETTNNEYIIVIAITDTQIQGGTRAGESVCRLECVSLWRVHAFWEEKKKKKEYVKCETTTHVNATKAKYAQSRRSTKLFLNKKILFSWLLCGSYDHILGWRLVITLDSWVAAAGSHTHTDAPSKWSESASLTSSSGEGRTEDTGGQKCTGKEGDGESSRARCEERAEAVTGERQSVGKLR